MTECQVGESIRLKAIFKDVNGNTTKDISIRNKLISDIALTKDILEKYYYDYNIPVASNWKAIWEEKTDNLNAIEEIEHNENLKKKLPHLSDGKLDTEGVIN